MKLLEALLSLLLFTTFLSYLFPSSYTFNTNLYKISLIGDIKNIIYYKTKFENLREVNAVIEEIRELTGICVIYSYSEIGSLSPKDSFKAFTILPSFHSLDSFPYKNLSSFTIDKIEIGPC